MNEDVCEVVCYDELKINRVKGELVGQNTSAAAELFKALADDTRMKIAYALSVEKELCVCDVASIIGTSVANASHHLRQLRSRGLAKFRKQGKLVFYSLSDEHVRDMIALAVTHSKEVGAHA